MLTMRVLPAGCVAWCALALAAGAGCSMPAGSAAVERRPAQQDMFAPLPLPPDFDRQRAGLSLAEVPDDPPPPASSAAVEPVELPPRASRLLEEARRLFSEHRYTETILKLEKALRYNANNHEARRMMALACLLSGSEARARLSAERGLAIKPDDLACHYVLGRLADKAGNTDDALRRYRTALKCKPTASDAGYRVLTHYHLGTLLDRERYHTAAIQQLEAFEAGLQSLGEKTKENPELAMIARIHRGPAAILVARGHEKLGQYAPAAEALKIAAAQSPKDVDLRSEYIRMLVLAGRVHPAAAEATRLVADTDGDRDAVELLLKVHRFAGQPQRGVAVMRDIIARQPDNVELWLLYTDALLSVRQHAEAVRTLKDLIARHAAASEARWKLIELYRSLGDWRAWLGALAKQLAVQPADYIRAGQELDRLGTLTAKRIAQEGISESPGKGQFVPAEVADDNVSAAVDYLLGCLCDRLELIDDARRLFERSARGRAGFLPPTIGLAQMYVRRCRWHEAIEVVGAADKARTGPAHQLECILAQCYDGLDDLEKAIEHYEKAIQINPTGGRSMMLLGQLYERTAQPRKARRQYQAALAVDSNNMLAREALIRNLLTAHDEPGTPNDRALLEFAEMRRLAPNDPATMRCSAVIKFLQDRDRRAYCEKLGELIRVHPDDLRSREELALTLFAFRDYQEARFSLGEIIARAPRSPVANEFMALVLMKLLDFEAAAEQFRRMLTWYPNRQAWIRSFAELRLIEQDYDAAIELWQRLLALEGAGPRRAAYRAGLMQAYRLAERADEARQVAHKWLAQAGADDRARSRLRWFLLAADEAVKDYDRYLERCRQWLEAEPQDRRIRGWLLGVRVEAPLDVFPVAGQFQETGGLIGAGRFDEAALLALEWLAETPDESELLDWLVEVLQAAGRHDEAIELLKSEASASGRPELRLQRLGTLQEAYARAGRYDQAADTTKWLIAEARKLLLRIDEDRSPILEEYIFEHRVRVGQLLSRDGRLDDAVDHFNRMLAEEGNEQRRAHLLRSLSFVHQRQERVDRAEERLRQAYQLTPTDVGLNNDLGYTLAEAGKALAEAERMTRLAVGEAPRVPAYQDSLAWVLYKKGELAEARTWLTRASSLPQGRDAVIFDHLGDVQWRLGEKDHAVKSWRRSLEVYERQVADGTTDPDEKLIARVKSKLRSAEAGGPPAVAPMAEQPPP